MESLPPPPLRLGPVLTAWHYLPSAELGGDIFDYFWLDGERFAFYVLDVCGHGVGAALHSVSIFNVLRQKALPNVDFASPAEVLQALDSAFPMERYGEMYFTIWYGVYDFSQCRLRFAGGGHPPAVLFVGERLNAVDLPSGNPPIGVLADTQFQEVAITPGFPIRVYLYSDGVYETAMPDGAIGNCRQFAQLLAKNLGKDRGEPSAVFEDVRAMTLPNRFDDDFSLLMLNFVGRL
ncbi:MAG: PP2C family protein-serine/threonine phosphatase [Candidatus Methylumidiphilus sp.]